MMLTLRRCARLSGVIASHGVCVALAAADPLRLAALRQLPRRLQHPVRAALQLDVRADRARHVLRHHDRRHRPLGRLGRGHGQRRLRPMLSPYGLLPGLLGGVAAGSPSASLNGFIITRHAASCPSSPRWRRCWRPAAPACCSPATQSVPVSYDTQLHRARPGRSAWALPVPGLDRARRLCPRLDRARTTPPSAARAGGRRRRGRLAADGPAGRPREVPRLCLLSGGLRRPRRRHPRRAVRRRPADRGRRLGAFAIASVVVGGTLLTGGVGSVAATLAGALLLGLLFNVLNFENGMGWISLSAYWQSVMRGAFLLLVVLLQARLTSRTT